ncbi:MAG: protein kinase [Planctomycetota bacterium]
MPIGAMMIDANDFEAMEALFHRVRELPPEQAVSEIESAGLAPPVRAMLDEMLEADREDAKAEADSSEEAASSAAHKLLGEAFGGPSEIDWGAAVDAAAQLGDAEEGGVGDLPFLLDGRYLLTEILGESIVGVTYRAVDQETRAKVAVRRIELVRRDGLSPRLRRTEIKRLAEIDHPSLERVLDTSGLTGPEPFVVTALLDGLPLDEWLTTSNPKWETGLRVFAKACRAIGVAHGARVLHRNLRPSAILVDDARTDDDGVPELAVVGFGLEIGRVGRASDPNAMICAAPELANIGARPTVQSDLYALGALLRWLATGDTTTVTGGAKRRWSRGLSVSAISAATPALAAVVNKAIHADPIRRHATAHALADDIEAFLDQELVPSYLHGPLRDRPGRRWVYRVDRFLRRRQRRTSVALATGAVLLLGSGATWALSSANRAYERAMEIATAAPRSGDWASLQSALAHARRLDLVGWRGAELRGLQDEALLFQYSDLPGAPGPRAQMRVAPSHAGAASGGPVLMRLRRGKAEALVASLESAGALDLESAMPDSVRISIAATFTDLDLHARADRLLTRSDASASGHERVRAVLDLRAAILREDPDGQDTALATLERLSDDAGLAAHERSAARLALAGYEAMHDRVMEADALVRRVLESDGTPSPTRWFAERMRREAVSESVLPTR